MDLETILTNVEMSIFSTRAVIFNKMFICDRKHRFTSHNDDIRAVTVNDVG